MTQDSGVKKEEKIIIQVDTELVDLVSRYIQNRHQDIKFMLESLEKGDYETIRIVGHNMKGTGGGYGFDAITDIGRSIEQAAKDRDAEEIRKWVNELSVYLELVEIVKID
jgi:HPt (histidine-containing phosphotransfer) domain-containing protein